MGVGVFQEINQSWYLEIQFFHVMTLVLVVPEMYGKDRGYSFVRRARHFLFWLLCDFFCVFLQLNMHFITIYMECDKPIL